MGDAFKCKNCGTVVETIQSCPSCGQTAMRPIQSSGDSDVVSDIVESTKTAASNTDDSDETETAESSASPESEAAETDSSDETERNDADKPDTASARSQPTTNRKPGSESGLLSWVKSLF